MDISVMLHRRSAAQNFYLSIESIYEMLCGPLQFVNVKSSSSANSTNLDAPGVKKIRYFKDKSYFYPLFLILTFA